MESHRPIHKLSISKIQVNHIKKTLSFLLMAVILMSQTVFPEKIQNIDDLQKLAEEGNSDAQCLKGLQEMLGGVLYDPRIINTVTVEQILMNKLDKWEDQTRFIPSYQENYSDISAGTKSKEAFQWIYKSAEQNNKIALFCLSKMYREGIGIPKNKEKSFECIKKSAELKFSRSYYSLGAMYFSRGDRR